MTDLAGTRRLLRFALERERVLLPVSVLALIGWMVMYAASYAGLYKTQASLDKFAASVDGQPALIALIGPTRALDTLGGAFSWEAVPVTAILTAVFAMFLVTRHTRAEEDDGRTDLLLTNPVGRLAPLAAAMALTAGAILAAAVGWFLALLAFGYDAGPSALLSLSVAGCGMVFAGITAICVQVAGSARLARGLVGLAIGGAWALRAVGDLGGGTLTWFSPLGWAQLAHSFSGARWWVLALPLAATLLTAGLSFLLLERRDIAAGLIRPRDGDPRGGRLLASPFGTALRLQRGTIAGWAAGMALYSFVVGTMGNSVTDLADSSPEIRAAFAAAPGDITDAFYSSILIVLALVAVGFAIAVALRPHFEEARDRATLPLAGPLSKIRWAGSHVLLSWLASLAVMLVMGLAMGLGLGLATGDFGRLPELLLGGLIQAPSMWVLVGLTVVLFGLSSRFTWVAWVVLAACWAIWTLQAFGNLPQWVLDLSPFTHTPLYPATAIDWAPLAAMTAIGAALTAAGLALWRRRDLA